MIAAIGTDGIRDDVDAASLGHVVTGHAAIREARLTGRSLDKYADPTEGPREGLTPEEAEVVAAEDPGLVYLP